MKLANNTCTEAGKKRFLTGFVVMQHSKLQDFEDYDAQGPDHLPNHNTEHYQKNYKAVKSC